MDATWKAARTRMVATPAALPELTGWMRAAHPGTTPCCMLPEPWLLVKQLAPL